MHPRLTELRHLVMDCVDKAHQLYELELDCAFVDVHIARLGNRAGTANQRGDEYTITFDDHYVDNHWDLVVTEIIPHEVAHLVCFSNPEYGTNHDAGWKRVCQSLGGSGARTIDGKLYSSKPFRQAERFRYNVDGHEIYLSKTRHERVQAQTTVYLLNGVEIHPHHWVDYDPSCKSGPRRTNKKQLVEAIVRKHYGKLTRAEIIELIMVKAQMSKAGASTYYHNATKTM